MAELPSRDDPIVCSLDTTDVPERLSEWQAVVDRAESRRTTPDGVEVRFPRDPELLSTLAALAAKEVACCSFFTFALTIDARSASLSVTTPPDGVALARELFGAT
jgi:hypothetical protein